MLEESIALANVIPDKAVIVILDERGESLDSADARRRSSAAGATTAGRPRCSSSAATTAWRRACATRPTVRLAFGAATWPHQLVRIMLLEQIYRAVTILSGHPYHRA